jgi:hypothetical protein
LKTTFPSTVGPKLPSTALNGSVTFVAANTSVNDFVLIHARAASRPALPSPQPKAIEPLIKAAVLFKGGGFAKLVAVPD